MVGTATARDGRKAGGEAKAPLVIDLEKVKAGDVALVGGKAASLGEMIGGLAAKGIRVPGGFAVTAAAYRYFITRSGLDAAIKKALSGLDTKRLADLQSRGKRVRALITGAEFPQDLKEAVVAAYRELSGRYREEAVDVAVRSSATAEDMPDASFAGQQDTYLNVRGEAAVLDATRRCFASLFTNRAISYRADKGYSHFDVALSVVVQKMVRGDCASSGVLFTIDTESGFRDAIFITAIYGLGENVVQGIVNPDEYYVFKPFLKERAKRGITPIISKLPGSKKIKMVYDTDGDGRVKNIPVPKEDRRRFVLTDEEILRLSEWALLIEEHYSALRSTFTPMDIEWAKDGDGKTAGTGEIFIVQARPETVHSQSGKNVLRTYSLAEKGKVMVTGRAVGEKVGRGEANVILSVSDISKFRAGQVLVTDITDPDWEPIMKVASAIVTNRGGRTCHAAIVSRELGIPCVVGTENATGIVRTGTPVTVSCCEGEEGRVYEGLLKFDVQEVNLETLPHTRTKIMMNAGIPEQAFAQGQLPNDGIGLAREEFIISSHIGIHPSALLNYGELKKRAAEDRKVAEVVAAIRKKTRGYTDKVAFFVDRLAQGIGMLAAGFWPNDVIVRMSDFKTNEYANLLGGYLYEPTESNPMIGWRGASRYYDPSFEPAFGLECRAIRKVRDEMGFTNVKVMIPFCRTPDEGRKVLSVMEKHGLKRGEHGLQVYVMCEIPSNVILADRFADIFDGFSIGTNDLTQLTLGLDRDSELVAHIYDERNEAVTRLLGQVIRTAKEKGRKIGICGQAPSDFPEIAEFLVENGIDSLSLNPDTVVKTRLLVAKVEERMAAKGKERK